MPAAGPEGGVLLNDGTALSEYDPQTDESVKLLEWADYAIDGSTVRLAGMLADGAIAVYCEDGDIIEYITRDLLLDFCLQNDMDSYVDWETGTCDFDSPQFKKLLEFVGRYGEEPDAYQNGHALASHEALLSIAPMTEPLDYQVAIANFGEPATAIGFPTGEGNGIAITVMDGICINSASQKKETAWAFIEYTLSEAAQKSSIRTGFPIWHDVYDAMLKEAMTPHYIQDENGNPVKEMPRYSIDYGDGKIDIYAMTEEEAESLGEIIDRIDRFSEYDDQLLAIVMEEAGAFFSGQKSVDEVADIIQKRVQVYVDESR